MDRNNDSPSNIWLTIRIFMEVCMNPDSVLMGMGAKFYI